MSISLTNAPPGVTLIHRQVNKCSKILSCPTLSFSAQVVSIYINMLAKCMVRTDILMCSILGMIVLCSKAGIDTMYKVKRIFMKD